MKLDDLRKQLRSAPKPNERCGDEHEAQMQVRRVRRTCMACSLEATADLRMLKRRLVDENGEILTRAGWVCTRCETLNIELVK